MKTISLYDIIESELQQRGYNEFVDDEGNWIAFEKEHQFIQKMIQFDDDVAEIVDELFFGTSSLSNASHDKQFKRLFLLNFMDREIAFQSVETFASKVMFTYLSNEQFILNVFESAEDFITGTQRNEQSSEDMGQSENITNNRNAFADLPQNAVNIDLNDDTMEFATNNTLSKNKQSNSQSNEQSSQGVTQSFQLDNLIKSQGLLAPVFQQLDQRCFLQIW